MGVKVPLIRQSCTTRSRIALEITTTIARNTGSFTCNDDAGGIVHVIGTAPSPSRVINSRSRQALGLGPLPVLLLLALSRGSRTNMLEAAAITEFAGAGGSPQVASLLRTVGRR